MSAIRELTYSPRAGGRFWCNQTKEMTRDPKRHRFQHRHLVEIRGNRRDDRPVLEAHLDTQGKVRCPHGHCTAVYSPRVSGITKKCSACRGRFKVLEYVAPLLEAQINENEEARCPYCHTMNSRVRAGTHTCVKWGCDMKFVALAYVPPPEVTIVGEYATCPKPSCGRANRIPGGTRSTKRSCDYCQTEFLAVEPPTEVEVHRTTGWVRCPGCSHESYHEKLGKHTCGRCNRKLVLKLKRKGASSGGTLERVEIYSDGYVECPHPDCYHEMNVGVTFRGVVACNRCQKEYEAYR